MKKNLFFFFFFLNTESDNEDLEMSKKLQLSYVDIPAGAGNPPLQSLFSGTEGGEEFTQLILHFFLISIQIFV